MTLLTAAVLRYYGVDVGAQVTYAAYLLGVILLPGLLVWRAARGRADRLVIDVVGGVSVGYALEIFGYLLGRAAGFPYAPAVTAAGILVAFASPRLRRHWRGSGERTPAPFAWSVAGLAVVVLASAALAYFRVHGLAWPANGTPSTDMAFHQSLTGELKHHLPARFPYLDGVPLSYHWFTHADWAATSWITGIEPYLITYRLGTLPLAMLSVLAFAVVIREIVGGPWWTGPVGSAFALLFVAPDPARWSIAVAPPAYLPRTMWISPTQTFAGLLFAGLVLLLVDRLRAPGRRAGTWLLIALLAAAVSGAKVTFLPILLAALLLITVVAVVRRSDRRTPAIAATIVVVALVAAQLTIYRGASGGLMLNPLQSLRAAVPRTSAHGWGAGEVATVWALCWATVLGAGAVLLRRGRLAEQPLLLCTGLGAAGLGAVALTFQVGNSHLYFLQSARPYLAAITVAGILAALPAGRRRWLALPPLAGLAAGAAVGYWPGPLGPARIPVLTDGTGWARAMWPYAVPLLAAVGLAGVVWLVRPLRSTALVTGLLLLVGAAVPASLEQWRLAHPVGGPLRDRIVAAAPHQTEPVIPAGAVPAGRWLRANTTPDERLATNNHCRFTVGQCDPRQFWVSGFAERRVLLEGWAYTPPANAYQMAHRAASNKVPYWNPALLADNDAAFTAPSASTLGVLRSRYGVTWLVVDTRRPHNRSGLDQAARLRFTTGQVAVYQLP